MSTRRGLSLTAVVFIVIVVLSLLSVADDHGEGDEKLLTVDEIKVIVNLHNALRSSENASNMNYMVSRRYCLIIVPQSALSN